MADSTAKKIRNSVDALRGVSQLAVEATKGATEIVEAMQSTIGGGPAVLGRPLEGPTRAIIGPIYAGIRALTTLVGAGIDVAFARAAHVLGESAPGVEREAMLAVLNGVLGDHLKETKNPLAIEMRFRKGGRALELEQEERRAVLRPIGGKALVLVHGSCLNDLEWNRRGHDHGVALERDLGYTPVYLHYNSGLHISTNGQALAEMLERLVVAWPVPLEEVASLDTAWGGSWRGALAITARSWATLGGESSASSFASGRRTTARRSSTAATGSMSCSAPPVTARAARAAGPDPQRRGHRHAIRQRSGRRLEGARPLRAKWRSPQAAAATRRSRMLCRRGDVGARARSQPPQRWPRSGGQRARPERQGGVCAAVP